MSASAAPAPKPTSCFTNYSEGVVFEPGRGLYWTANDVTDERVDHDEAEAAVSKLNEQSFGGFTDWRLPTVEELFLLADRNRCNPAIDTSFFPSCRSDWYWASTDDASEEKDSETGHTDFAWFVHFYDGNSCVGNRGGYNRVRAVRGPAR